MMARVLSLAFVTFIAILVWVLAEGQTLRSTTITADLRLDAGSNTRALRVSPDDEFTGRVELRVSGSGSGIDELSSRLRDPITLHLGAEIPFQAGQQTFDLHAALRRTELFRRIAVSLNDVDPATITIDADELTTIDVPVAVELPDVQIEGAVRTDPETVAVTLPKSFADTLEPGAATMVAHLSADTLNRLTPGVEQRIDGARLQASPALAASWFVRSATPQVSVVLTLRSRTATEIIPTVPVQVRIAPSELSRFDITVAEDDRFLHDVTLRGPSPLIERIRSDPSLRPVAVLVLSFEELERGIESKDATIILPPGFGQVEARADILAVRLKITRRDPEPAGE